MTTDAGDKPETPPDYHGGFARIAGVVALLLAAALLWRPIVTAWGIGKDDWLGDAGDRALAASIAVLLVAFGGVLVAVGAWMAAVEWRGRFKKPEAPQARGGLDAIKGIIESVGKLRGAALVLVVGGLLMLGAAWIGQSSADSGSGEAPPAATTGG